MAKHKGVYLQRLMKSCEGIDFPEAALVEIEKATEGFIVKYTEQDLQTAANRVLENYDMVPGTSLSEVPAADEINDTLVESAFKGLLDVGEDKQLRIKAMDVFTQTLFLNNRLRETIEGHVGSIISYAQKRFKEATATSTNLDKAGNNAVVDAENQK